MRRRDATDVLSSVPAGSVSASFPRRLSSTDEAGGDRLAENDNASPRLRDRGCHLLAASGHAGSAPSEASPLIIQVADGCGQGRYRDPAAPATGLDADPIRAGIMEPTGPGGRDPALAPETVAAPAGIEVPAALAIGSGEGLILAAITAPIVIDPCPFANAIAQFDRISVAITGSRIR
jgi:hypothetical protein